MDINYYSFIMAVIWSSIIIMLLYISQKRKVFIKHFGVINLVILYISCGVRLLLPIEFSFVKTVELPGIYSRIYELIGLTSFSVLGFQTTIVYLFVGIWLAGSLIIMTSWSVQYYQVTHKLCVRNRESNLQCETILSKVQNRYHRKINVKVSSTPLVDVPIGLGIFKKTILLPEGEYSEEELYYILLHEYTHFINRDIEVKLLIHIFCCVFWWNPCVYLLKKDLDQTLEIKCDLTLTKPMDENSKMSYMNVIISMFAKAQSDPPGYFVALVRQTVKEAVAERLQVVVDEHQPGRKTKILYCGGVLFLCLMMGFSYRYQFQSVYEIPESELLEGNELTPENTYLLDNGDGSYTIIDSFGGEDVVTDTQWIIDDMISKGFSVEVNRREE